MKFLKTLFFMCLWFQGAVAQQSLSDSLQNLLTTPIPDTTRVLVLDQLGRSLMYSKPLVAMQYAQEGLAIARKIDYQRGEARIQNRIGTIFRITGNYGRSLEAHLASIAIATDTHDIDALARTYNNLGNLYSEEKNGQKAIDYYQKTAALATRLNNINLKRIALSNIGSEYALQNQLDSALAYTRIAYQFALKLKVEDIQIELMILAYIYTRLNRNQLALGYFRKSIPASLAVKNNRTLSQTYLEMAEVYQKINQPDSALFFAKKSLQLAQSSDMLDYVLRASTIIVELYEPTNPRLSLTYFKLASVAKDSLVSIEKAKNFQNVEFSEKIRQQELLQAQKIYRSRIILYVLLGVVLAFLIIALLLYRNNRQQQKANALLKQQRDEINVQRDKAEETLSVLKATQMQLIQKEKLASLGELTAGIAHEIQNPLNFVNNFAEVSTELAEELGQEARAGHTEDVLALADDLTLNLERITHHGKRASAIVRGMLEHSRASTGERQPTDLNALVSEYLQLAYQGLQRAGSAGNGTMRSTGLPDRGKLEQGQFSCELVTDFAPNLPPVSLVPQDMGRVLLNLFNNAFYAVRDRQQQEPDTYQPMVSVQTRQTNSHYEIRVVDNGKGIPDAVKTKIFQPFFTTKPTGEGTGLGLSLSYDIVTREYGGTLTVETKANEFTRFIINLPA